MTYVKPTFSSKAEGGDRRYYVYAHADESGIFYIGKGRMGRAWSPYARSAEWYERASGKCVTVTLLHFGLTNREALMLERSILKTLSPSEVVNKVFVTFHLGKVIEPLTPA